MQGLYTVNTYTHSHAYIYTFLKNMLKTKVMVNIHKSYFLNPKCELLSLVLGN